MHYARRYEFKDLFRSWTEGHSYRRPHMDGTAFRRLRGHYYSLNSSPPPMTMLRISINESEGNVVTLRLEGQIVGAWISELGGACERMLTAGPTGTPALARGSFVCLPA